MTHNTAPRHGDWFRGDWFQTFTGRQFYLLDPRIEDINPVDIAHALAHTCRYNGHCRELYTVAQHSVLVSAILPRELAFVGLMHDAAEAYTGDVIRPLKLALREAGAGFDAIEDRIERLVAQRFGLPHPWPKLVKWADNVLLATERRDMLTVQREWSLREAPLEGFHIQPWSPEIAKMLFLDRFRSLLGRGPWSDDIIEAMGGWGGAPEGEFVARMRELGHIPASPAITPLDEG